MANINQVTAQILSDMPPETRFTNHDADCLAKHRDLLLGLEDRIVQGFYDVLFAHSETAEILNKDGREKRETTLRTWWKKTLNSDFNDDYWEWQVFVGLVHIKQKVTNPMMISMWGWLLIALRSELQDKLPSADYVLVLNAFGRLASCIQALIAESVMLNSLQAITDATGFNPKLMDRIVGLQIDGMIKQSQQGR